MRDSQSFPFSRWTCMSFIKAVCLRSDPCFNRKAALLFLAHSLLCTLSSAAKQNDKWTPSRPSRSPDARVFLSADAMLWPVEAWANMPPQLRPLTFDPDPNHFLQLIVSCIIWRISRRAALTSRWSRNDRMIVPLLSPETPEVVLRCEDWMIEWQLQQTEPALFVHFIYLFIYNLIWFYVF